MHLKRLRNQRQAQREQRARELAEAAEKVTEANEEMKKTLRAWPAVHRVAQANCELQDENHFAQALRDLIPRNHPAAGAGS